MTDRRQLEEAIASLEAQRGTLGDAVINPAIAGLQSQLAELVGEHIPQTRKQVTVLFADVSGFTAMSETLDAEEVSDIMNALWGRLDACLLEHGGLIDKHLGDGVMALWGAKAAREDDPECAIRAALAMQEAVSRSSVSDVGLPLRIGVHTGPVLLGEVGTKGELSAIGDTVNLASRLQETAPTGEVLISHDTYRHVRGTFDVLPRELIQVKGKTRPIQTYLVQRAKPHAFRMETRGVEEVETRMVGRDAELLTLQNIFHDIMEDGEMCIVTIVGEAGVGKSRLLYEFDKWIGLLSDKTNRFKGWAAPGMQATSYDAIRRMFAHRFGVQESDSAAAVRDKFRTGMAAALKPAQADLVGQLIGFDVPASQALQRALASEFFRERALAGLIDYLRAVAREPTLIFLEDMHWADDSSLDLIDHLAEVLSEARLLVVCLARPTLFERRPYWGEGQEAHIRLELKALSRRESRALVAEILQRADEIPVELRDLVVEGAEGNPFYVEELIKMLIDDGVIRSGEGCWQVELERLAEVRVPPTLIGVLQARLDSLPPDERGVLQRASVIGRLFWGEAVARLGADEAEGFDEERLVPLLDAVRRRELVLRREHSTFAGTEEYTFKHALLRDVTYETVLLKLRRVYHNQVAAWLEGSAGERLGEYLGLIARHYELAGDQPEKAIAFLLQAGRRAVKLSAHEEAIGYLKKGLDLLPALPDNAERNRQELTLLVALGPPLFAAKGYAAPEVERTYSRARELCGQVEETAQLLPVLSGLCSYYMVRPDYQKLRELGEEFLERSQRAQDPAYQAAALFMLGGDATWQGELESAREYLKRSIDLSGSEQCRNLISTLNMEPGIWSFTYLAYVLWLLGYPDQGLKRTQEVLALAHDLDYPFILAYTFCVSGVHHYFRQEEQIVREQAEAAIALSTEYGFAQWMAQGGILRGWALAQQGEGGEEHCAKMHQAMDAWRATGADVGRPYYLLLLAQTHEKLGQIEEGLDLLTEALALTENNREYWLMAELYRVKGELLLAQSKDISADEVEDCFHQAIKFARQQDAKSLELRAVMSLSRLWQKSGKREQARQMLEEVYSWFTEGFDTADLQEAKQLLGELACS